MSNFARIIIGRNILSYSNRFIIETGNIQFSCPLSINENLPMSRGGNISKDHFIALKDFLTEALNKFEIKEVK